MPACTVCKHPDRAEIDALLVSHTPVRSIARQFGLIETSLRRHAARHLSRELVRAAEGRDLERAGSLLDGVEALQRDTLAVLEQARDGGDMRTILAAIKEQRANLELVGRIKGELVASGTVAVFMRFGVRDDAELQSLIEGGRKFKEMKQDATNLEDYAEDCVELLQAIFRKCPQLQPGILKRLGTHAIVVESNGHSP